MGDWSDGFQDGHSAAKALFNEETAALRAEIANLGTALAAAKNDLEALRQERDLLQRVIDETDSLAEVERDNAIYERDRLAAQVARVREAHTDLTRRLAESEDGAIGASDLTALFDALYPKWSEPS